jgi:hypothetical protein
MTDSDVLAVLKAAHQYIELDSHLHVPDDSPAILARLDACIHALKAEQSINDEDLGVLIEECGEVLKAAGKAVRFGLSKRNPLPGASRETNEQWLEREIADLQYAISRLIKSRGWKQKPDGGPK